MVYDDGALTSETCLKVKNYLTTAIRGCDTVSCKDCFAYKYTKGIGWSCEIEHLFGTKPTKQNGGLTKEKQAYFHGCMDTVTRAQLEKNAVEKFYLCGSCSTLLSEDDLALISVENEETGDIQEVEGCPECGNAMVNLKAVNFILHLFCTSGKVHEHNNFPEVFEGDSEEKCELLALQKGWSIDKGWVCPSCSYER